MFHRCLVHLLILLTAATLAVASPDGDVLLAFKNALQDPENALQSWDSSLVDPCTYFHVTCDSDNRVVRLDLGYYNLSGNLIPALGKLDRLQYLELYFNNLSGTIPEELGGLKSLRSLDLYNNNLSGSIPDSLSNLSNLAFLRINDNKLTGCIPVGVTKLPNLSVFDVSNNNIFGTCT